MAKDKKPSQGRVPSGDNSRFSIGDAVRVRAGVIDPDFPDIPIAGWVGAVVDIEAIDPPLYLVHWTRETLARMAPAYRVRCERAGLDPEMTSLLGEDLERDTGIRFTILPPPQLPPGLDRNDPADRVRSIFKLTGDDPLPPVDAASLRRFHEHFRKKMKLPAAAICTGAPQSEEPARIKRLLPFEEAKMEEGLLVEVEQGDMIATGPLYDVSLLSENAVAKDVEAYSEWFFDAPDEEPDEESIGESTLRFVEDHLADDASAFAEFKASLPYLLRVALGCILVGALAGALFWVHEWAMVMAEGGAAVLGFVVCFSVVKSLLSQPNEGRGLLTGIGAAVLMTLIGASVGAFVGVLLLAYVGAIPGALAGVVFGMVLTSCGVRNHNTLHLALLGSYIGAVVYVFQFDAGEAIAGALRGAAAGLGECLFFVVGSAVASYRIEFARDRD